MLCVSCVSLLTLHLHAAAANGPAGHSQQQQLCLIAVLTQDHFCAVLLAKAWSLCMCLASPTYARGSLLSRTLPSSNANVDMALLGLGTS